MLKLRHTGIFVHDLENMKDFYCGSFGMQEAVHAFEKGHYIETVLGLKEIELELYKLRFYDGTMIELLHRKGEKEQEIRSKIYEAGQCHIAITIEDVDWIFQDLSQKGIRFISCPMFSADGTAKVCFCKDPEGNYIELVEELHKSEKVQ